jgi:hypothetical protein
MKALARALAVLAVFVALVACSSGTTSTGKPPPPDVEPPPFQFMLAAGLVEVKPAAQDTLSGTVDLTRFGAAAFDRVYELETPAGVDFAFNLVARETGNFGTTVVSFGHVSDGGVVPTVGVESFVLAGITMEAPGLSYRGNTVELSGDGFVRGTVRGRIQADQVGIVQIAGLTPRDPGIREGSCFWSGSRNRSWSHSR